MAFECSGLRSTYIILIQKHHVKYRCVKKLNLEIWYFCVDQLYGIDNINNQNFLNQNLHEILRRWTRGLKFSCKKIVIFHCNNTKNKYTFRRHEQHGGSVALMTLSSEIAITYKININSIYIISLLHRTLIFIVN